MTICRRRPTAAPPIHSNKKQIGIRTPILLPLGTRIRVARIRILHGFQLQLPTNRNDSKIVLHQHNISSNPQIPSQTSGSRKHKIAGLSTAPVQVPCTQACTGTSQFQLPMKNSRTQIPPNGKDRCSTISTTARSELTRAGMTTSGEHREPLCTWESKFGADQPRLQIRTDKRNGDGKRTSNYKKLTTAIGWILLMRRITLGMP